MIRVSNIRLNFKIYLELAMMISNSDSFDERNQLDKGAPT